MPIVSTEILRKPEDIDIQWMKGIGPRRAAALKGAGISTVRDLLYHFPRRYLDRSMIVPFRKMYDHAGEIVTGVGRVASIVAPRGKKRIIVTLNDAHGVLEVIFFQGLNYWLRAFDIDEAVAVSGRVNAYGPKPGMIHPDIDRLADEDSADFLNTGGIIPVYPSSAELEKVGLNRHGGFRRILRNAVDAHLGAVEEHLPPSLLKSRGLAPLRESLHDVHFPPSQEKLDKARRRLAYDELFLHQLQLAGLRWRETVAQKGIPFNIESRRARRLVESLPFELTRAQKRVLREIAADMRAPHPMNRLLQGDVGSGKTVVALLAMLVAVENGFQAAFMAPTEILAEQHYKTILSLLHDRLGDLGVRVELLVGRQKSARRKSALARIAAGSVDVVVGTHALIQAAVEYHNLGFVVIDEQHRFGVAQRAELRRKGFVPDVLVMTATPIPRTLAMTLYGDLDLSVIDEMPKNRKPVKTVARFEEDRTKVMRFLQAEIDRGRQAYVVLPLVEESEKLDLKAATAEYEALKSNPLLSARVGLLHGQMPPEEKDAAMSAFLKREIDLLVATTVIEVGIDVPNATVMLIEHAERFGLSQLHQLRGRIGRGAEQSYCILMTDRKFFYGGGRKAQEESEERAAAKRRLDTMVKTADGFKIAEEDLALRGPGDFLGTEQHGFPAFKIADIVRDRDILMEARSDAFAAIERDPHLRDPEYARVREIMVARMKQSAQETGIA